MSSSLCILCGLKSKIPIRETPTPTQIGSIICNAIARVESKNFGKYKINCEELSKAKCDDLMNAKRRIAFHRSCYKDFTRLITLKSSSANAGSELKLDEFLSNYIDRVNVVNGYVDIGTITEEYKAMSKSSSETSVRKNVKSYLQTRDDVFILRPFAGRQTEIVASRKLVETVFFNHYLDSTDDFEKLSEAFEKVRRMLLAEPEWQFEGNFKNFKVCNEILSLFRILIGGKHPHPLKKEYVDKSSLLLVQYIESVMLSKRQVRQKVFLL